MFFGIFVLNRVSNLSFFVLIRVSIYHFCLKQDVFSWTINSKSFTSACELKFGLNVLNRVLKNRNSVLNSVGKSAIFVLNRARV